MCGIFTLICKDSNKITKQTEIDIIKNLFKYSESRGKDAAGIATIFKNKIKIYKEHINACNFIKLSKFNKLINEKNIKAVIGHARMQTNGSFEENYNNQPVVKDNWILVHNGIIVNNEKLWTDSKEIKQKYKVDTEIINSILNFNIYTKKVDLIYQITNSLNLLEGAFSIIGVSNYINELLIATNTGSLYIYENENFIIIASEKYFLQQLNKSLNLKGIIKQIKPLNCMLINLQTFKKQEFNLKQDNKNSNLKIDFIKKRKFINIKNEKAVKNKLENKINTDYNKIKNLVLNEYEQNFKKISKLKRCTKCILPETMPFIEFNENGVCNYCKNYKPFKIENEESLKSKLNKYKFNSDRPNCIVAFSGGRDSSFSLHYIKNVLKMNPIAYSYDWGMLTDLGRRNQAIMTGELGIEHILISADIQKKRLNIKKNIEAWLKRPRLGTIPLFMAGDKQYFYYLNKLKKQMNINLTILAENPFERTDFKSGFCGIAPETKQINKVYYLSIYNKLKLLFYYLKEFILNPAYINSSIIDTATAFISYYFIKHNNISIFDYLKWNEQEIDNILKKYYWETSPDTDTTWRIGDGTSAFYNYIYYTMAGLTENDTFRSNQIRNGQITREQGLKLSLQDNKPQINNLIWYANTINLDLEKAIKIINNVKKLY